MIRCNSGGLGRGFVGLVLLIAPVSVAAAQEIDPLVDDSDTAYFDFWPGTWVAEVGGVPDTAGTRFDVVPSVPSAAFEESWRLVLDDGQELHATALRAWDKTAGRWMYTWVSDNGLYQVWEGRKDRHGWWIYKHFDVNGPRARVPSAHRRWSQLHTRAALDNRAFVPAVWHSVPG